MTEPFKTLLADPPWTHPLHGGLAFKRGAAFDYKRGALDQAALCGLRPLLDPLLSKDAALLLWVPNSMIPQGCEVVEAWGFEYKTAVPWVKYSGQTGKVQMAIGWWVHGCSETLMLGVRKGAAHPEERLLGLLEGDYIEAPRYPHVRKPSCVHELAEGFAGPHLEMFATQKRDGWTTLGIELSGQDIREELELLGKEAGLVR